MITKRKTKKKTERYVLVDMGYGPAENWQTAKVCSETSVKPLFGDGFTTQLLVELPGEERTWVADWKEIPQPAAAPLKAKPKKLRVKRAAFICKYCEGVYADEPVSQCDCLGDIEGKAPHFIKGEIRYSVSENSTN